MEISILLAKILGIFLLVISIPMMFFYQYLLLILDDFYQNRSGYFLLTMLLLIFGTILIVCWRSRPKGSAR